MNSVEWVVYSDFLCPWCFNAFVRLRRLEDEADGKLRLLWRSFLLRPQARVTPVDKFRAYTQTWQRPAEDPDGGTFRIWSSAAGPPSHSVPPHIVAKAAAEQGEAIGRDVHERLLRAYFTDNRNITDPETLAAIWSEAGLSRAAFTSIDEVRLSAAVQRDYEEALGLGITGVPAVRVNGETAFISGAQPYETYRRWLARLLAAE